MRFADAERINLAPTGKRFRANFIVPNALISYKDVKGGVDLIRKEVIDRCLSTMIGAPLTIKHPSKDIILSRDFTGVEHGKVDKVGYDDITGFYFAEGSVDTDAARERINAGDGTSCGFTVLEVGPRGTWGQIPYTQEDTSIEFHHLALVEKPRIEEADIRLNSTKPSMNILKLFRKSKDSAGKETVTEIPIALTTKFDLGDGDGKSVTMQELIDHERANEVHMIGADDYCEHEGVRYNAMDLINHYKEHCNSMRVRMNAKGQPETEAEKATREAQERINSAIANAGGKVNADGTVDLPAGKYVIKDGKIERANAAPANETPEQKASREKNEAQAAIDQRIAEARADERRTIQRENEAAAGRRSFITLAQAPQNKGQETAAFELGDSGSLDDGVALGRERYGRKPTNSRMAGSN